MKQQNESNQGKPVAIPVERSKPAIASGCPREPSNPSNTDGSNCKVLRMGVDSLYLSFAGDLTDEGRTKLELARDAARSGLDEQEAKAQVSILDHHLKASPSAGKLFRYLISDHAFRIQLKRQGQTHCALAYGKIASHS